MPVPFQTINEGLASPKESVVSKQELIQSVMGSLRQDQQETAANLYRRAKEDIGYELMNAIGRGELARPLATMFLQVKDFYKAAQVFERLDRKREAAQNYGKAGACDLAAELFANIGELAASAEMYERGGSYGRAAELFDLAEQGTNAGRNYAKVEEYFLAGRAFARSGDEMKALECLQKVRPDNASYPEAVELLGPILEKMGFAEIAIEKYRGIVADKGVSPENVKVFYRIARMQESAGRLDEARQTYSKILEVDIGYEDVQQRYRALKDPAQTIGACPAPPFPGAQCIPTGLIVLDEDTSLIEKSVLFQDLTFEEKRTFLAMAERRTFKAGEPLLLEGNPLPGLALLHHGTVGVGMKLDGKNINLRRFGPGDHFGEMTVCESRNARVTAVAETDGDYLIVPGDRVRCLLEGSPALAVKVLKNLIAAMDVHLDQFRDAVRAVWRHGSASGPA
jgi:tetratricopeptide (TPR) repeat protein